MQSRSKWRCTTRAPRHARAAITRLRRRHLGAIRPLFGHADARLSAACIVTHIALAIASGVLVSAVEGTPAVHLGAILLAIGFIGTRMRALGNMMHEAAHDQLAVSPQANRRFGQCLSVLLWSDFETYRMVHLSHHRHLGNREKDGDLRARLATGLARHDRPLWWHLGQAATLRALPSLPQPTFATRNDPVWVVMGRMTYLTALLALAVFDWSVVVLWVVVPYLTSYAMICYASDALDHGRIALHPDELQRSRNHRLPLRGLDWMFQPRNDAYHLVHHLFPKVPTAALPAAHRMMMRDPVYSALEHRLTAQVLTDTTPLTLARAKSNPHAVSEGKQGALEQRQSFAESAWGLPEPEPKTLPPTQ